MFNLIVVTLPTMHFRRAPETRNLFATRRLYIHIYITTVDFIVSTSSTRFHRGKSCYRCYNRLSPYPKVTSKQPQGTPLSIFIDSRRRKKQHVASYFPLSIRQTTNLLGRNNFISNERSYKKPSAQLFEMLAPRIEFRKLVDCSRFDFDHEEKRAVSDCRSKEKGAREREKERAAGSHRRRETVRFASQVREISGMRNYPVSNCVPRGTIVQRKVTARAGKKEAQLVPFSVRGQTVLPLLSFSRMWRGQHLFRHLFFGQVKLSFISSGRNEPRSLPQKGEAERKLPMMTRARFPPS